MELFGINLGEILTNLPALLQNPMGIIGTIIGALAAIMGGPHVLNYITTLISDGILFLDNRVVDLIPIPPLKAYFQNQIVNMLKASVARYQKLIKDISD